MNEYDATEIAYKNGYKKGAMDVMEDIKKYLTPKKMGLFNYNYIDFIFDEIKKKYTEGDT